MPLNDNFSGKGGERGGKHQENGLIPWDDVLVAQHQARTPPRP
jgi:hypothetical protein